MITDIAEEHIHAARELLADPTFAKELRKRLAEERKARRAARKQERDAMLAEYHAGVAARKEARQERRVAQAIAMLSKLDADQLVQVRDACDELIDE